MKDTTHHFLIILNFPMTILTQNTENEYNSNHQIMNAMLKVLQFQKSHWSNNAKLQCVSLAQTDLIGSINKNNSFIYSLTTTCSYKMLASWWLPFHIYIKKTSLHHLTGHAVHAQKMLPVKPH
jgi:hypothetical protein